MDQCMPISEAVNRSFSKRYIIAINDKPDANLPAQIVQIVKSSRPHYCLMIKNSYHDIVAQRNNLFVALIVFILQIKEEYSGYLNMVNLGSKQINLLSVLDTDNDYGKYSGSSSSKGSVGRR
ncbi:hypothetical protein EV182_007981 [Spiromyces aspiralis]|uniref:Uncharacterized protein n=1 Tax=Spiromyces aspiralis TaxID=68401 RepID=A0ACC1H7E8_9FUNG|nr:hypothetical protein EV182_007981 [Spiromyces aspiralis]